MHIQEKFKSIYFKTTSVRLSPTVTRNLAPRKKLNSFSKLQHAFLAESHVLGMFPGEIQNFEEKVQNNFMIYVWHDTCAIKLSIHTILEK